MGPKALSVLYNLMNPVFPQAPSVQTYEEIRLPSRSPCLRCCRICNLYGFPAHILTDRPFQKTEFRSGPPFAGNMT